LPRTTKTALQLA